MNSPAKFLILMASAIGAVSIAAPRAHALDVAPEPVDAEAIRGELKAIVDDFNATRGKYSEAMRAAKTDADRKKVSEELALKPGQFSARALSILDRPIPKEVEYEVLSSTLNLMPTEAETGTIVDRIIEAHLNDDRAATLAAKFMYGAEGKLAELLDAMIERSESRTVKGTALLARASGAKWRADGDPAILAAAESDFDRVVAEFADVPYRKDDTLGGVASRNLFELRELAIGKVCPEIVGTDVDDVEFKLSDYKGKVVFLDFWGFW